MEPSASNNSSPTIPIAIVIGFAMIALAIFFTGGKDETTNPVAATVETEVVSNGGLPPLTDNDYIRGNPNAPIVLIEYSDYECPFCKQFHDTMKLVIDEYGVDGKVAWAYRQYPLAQLHPNAPKISEAALCVGDLGGNNAFWDFSDLIFEQREINEFTNVTKLADYAELSGVDKNEYIACMNDGRMKSAVEESVAAGFEAGIRSTPHTVLITGSQEAVIDGARSYTTVRAIVANLIDQLDGNFDPDAAAIEQESEVAQ